MSQAVAIDEPINSLFEFLHNEIISYVFSCAEDNPNACISRLESIGFRIGQSLAEQLTKDSPRFKDDLEIMKFICRDFWNSLFKKQVDNLRTNHQGIYVLQDNKFKILTQMSTGKQYIESAPRYLAMSCGIVRGVLSSLGINSIVTAEVIMMPAVKFQIMLQRN